MAMCCVLEGKLMSLPLTVWNTWKKKASGAGDVTQLVECPLGLPRALGSNPVELSVVYAFD